MYEEGLKISNLIDKLTLMVCVTTRVIVCGVQYYRSKAEERRWRREIHELIEYLRNPDNGLID